MLELFWSEGDLYWMCTRQVLAILDLDIGPILDLFWICGGVCWILLDLYGTFFGPVLDMYLPALGLHWPNFDLVLALHWLVLLH